ncbi:hypothetical protein Efla_006211 [Eimeria flavescens]
MRPWGGALRGIGFLCFYLWSCLLASRAIPRAFAEHRLLHAGGPPSSRGPPDSEVGGVLEAGEEGFTALGPLLSAA